MSSEAWALAGVALGAVLGAVAQMLTERLRRRHDALLLTRSERREAYTEFLAASGEALRPLVIARYAFEASQEAEPKSVSMDHQASVAALNRLGLAISRVHLVAPDDTHQAAMTVHAATMMFMFKDEEGMVEKLADGQAAFRNLAQRDLRLS